MFTMTLLKSFVYLLLFLFLHPNQYDWLNHDANSQNPAQDFVGFEFGEQDFFCILVSLFVGFVGMML